MPTLRFSRNIRSMSSRIENAGPRFVKAAAKRSLRTLVYGTKVDKGVARSNWRVGLGAPTRAVIPAYAPYPKGSKAKGAGMGERANAAAAIAAGNARLSTIGRGRLTTAIYISNSIPYGKTAFPTGLLSVAAAEASIAIKGLRVLS